MNALVAAISATAACTPSSSASSTASSSATGSSAPSSVASAPPPRLAATSSAAAQASSAPAEASAASAPEQAAAIYPWGPTASPDDRLDRRVAPPPPGFRRVDVAEGSFAAFLRTLPLKPAGSPVVDYQGNRLYDDGRHPNIVAVADLDIGSRDLQHCADVIVRLHAEWRYGRGDRDIVYKSVSGQPLAYRRYVAGERAFASGNRLVFRPAAAPRKDDHAAFRAWLDDVFSWAGTASIERDGAKVTPVSAIKGGDFFVMSGTPFGHAVLVLDVAKDDAGRLALLLGQSYMPAQSFQVLRPRPDGGPWFVIEPEDTAVTTPFWRPFPLSSLRRL